MKRWAVMVGMMRGCGFAVIVYGIISIMAAGSASAWPRPGIVGHFSHGRALNRGPVSEQGAKIDVPENSKNVEGDKKMEDGKKLDRQYIDVGP